MEHSENNRTSSNPETEWGKTFTEKAPSNGLSNQNEPIPAVNKDMYTSSLTDSLIGETLGSGTVIEKLGEGGMGRVYKIENKKFDMYHAVKIMINASDDTAIKRFHREAKILARLNHPSIVRIFNFGTWKQNFFIEMEYIEGSSLDDILKEKKGPLDIITTLAIGIIVGNALNYAHLHKYELNNEKCTGLIHRDLKPGNIMISKSGEIKLLDFGIARPIGESVVTLTTGIVGSWSYLPPEQLDGCAVDHRVDIYALGTVLYELVTGITAFPFENIKQLLSIKTKGSYEPIKKVNPEIPDKIVSVIDKSIEVKPENRYKDIHEFTTDLQKLFSALTKETPEAVLENFVEYKKIVTGNEKKLTKVKTASDKKLITFKSVILIGIVIVIFLLGLFALSRMPWGKTSPVLPVPLFPGNNTSVKDPSVLFQWKATSPGDTYILEVTEHENFVGAFIFRGVISDTFITISSFKPGHTYYWRVQKQGKIDMWTASHMFSVEETGIKAPVLVSPSDKNTVADSSVLLKWTAVNNVEQYQIQTAKDTLFTSTSTIFDRIIKSEKYLINNLENNETYFWRVCALKSGDKKSSWSSVGQFFTKWEHPPLEPLSKDDQLKETYGTGIMIEIVKKAIARKKLADAEYGLSKLPRSPINDSLSLQLTWLLLNSNKYNTAKKVLSGVDSKDSFAHLCRGRIYMTEKNYPAALKEFKNSLRTKTIFNLKSVNMNVSWYFACATHDYYFSNKSEEKKQQAIKAWEDVKKHYSNNSSNPRYKKALEKIDQLSK